MKQMPRISAAEWQVMKTLWDNSPATTNEVVDALTPVTTWKPKTIMTMLSRLVKKGALAYKKKGRSYEYYPLVGAEECIKFESRTFLERVYDGAHRKLLVSFLEDAELSDDDIGELKEMLEQRGKK